MAETGTVGERVFLYGEAVPDTGLDTLHIEPIRTRSAHHGWVIQPHLHPAHVQLLLFTRGRAEIRVEGEILMPEAGTLVVYPAGSMHEIRYRPDTEGLTITVAATYVDELLADAPELARPLMRARAEPLGPTLTHAFERAFATILEETQRAAPGWRIAVRGAFLGVLVLLYRQCQQADQPVAGRRDRQLAQGLRTLVESHFRTRKKMAFYAGALGVSPQRLNAACKSALDRSASQLLHDRIMVEARRRLAYTDMGVAEIGHDLGFDDAAYFNRFFAKRAGVSPGAWRRTFSTLAPPGAESVE